MTLSRSFALAGALLFCVSCSSHKTAKIATAPSAALMARAADPEKRSHRLNAVSEKEMDEPDRAEGPEPDNAAELAQFFLSQRWQGPGDFPVERYVKAKTDSHRLPSIALGARSGANAHLSQDGAPTFGTWQPLG